MENIRQDTTHLDISQIESWLPPLPPALISVDPGSLKVQEGNGNQGLLLQIGLYQTGRQKAAADPIQKIGNELCAVVNLKGKLVKGRKKLSNKLSDLLEGEVAEQIIEH